jgi:hypothetical protein
MGQFCDSDCQIVLDKHFIYIHHEGKLVLQGTRSPVTRLWHLHFPAASAPSNTPTLPTTPSHCANAILPFWQLSFLHWFLPCSLVFTYSVYLVQSNRFRFPHHLAWTHFHSSTQASTSIRSYYQRTLKPTTSQSTLHKTQNPNLHHLPLHHRHLHIVHTPPPKHPKTNIQHHS